VERWAFHVSASEEGKTVVELNLRTCSAIDTRHKELGGACPMDEPFDEDDLSSRT
jgi:hypothetical protein